MRKQEFIDYIAGAFSAAAQLMDAPPDAFSVGADPRQPAGYSRMIHFGEEEIRLALHKDVAPSLLLNMFVDAAANRIDFSGFPLAYPSSKMFIPSVNGPCSPQQWGEDLYRDVQNQLVQSFSFGLSLGFELIDNLSAQRYEGSGCRGGLVFECDESRDLSSLLSIPIEAAEEIAFKKDMVRQIRKLLAGAGDHFLVFQRRDGEYLCLGYCSGENASRFPWRVRLSDVLDWELSHYGRPLFRFFHNDPKIIRDPVSTVLKELETEFKTDLSRARPLLESGAGQSHGTALIFMDFGDPHISGWVDRLYKHKRAFRLSGPHDAPAAVQRLSGMDGAILIDVHKMEVRCFAAMMDGRTTVGGDLARGSRHNGIRTFVADLAGSSPNQASRLAAVVFSEDGGAVTIRGSEFPLVRPAADEIRELAQNTPV